LKDATLVKDEEHTINANKRMDTELMNKKLEESLHIAKKKLDTIVVDDEAAPKTKKQEKDAKTKNLNEPSMTVNSQTTSIMFLQNKLNQVISPSSSKPDDDDYDPEIDEDGLHMEESQSDLNSAASIPMAHREYEKILRQLEAECRTHIKCEQQMKLHIECL